MIPFGAHDRAGSKANAQSLVLTIAIACGIVCCQVLFALYFSVGQTPLGKYRRLALVSDSNWYASVVDRGYVIAKPANSGLPDAVNVSFFPGYPLSALAVKQITGLQTRLSLAIAAQLASVGFWTYFLLLCRRWNISSLATASAACAVLAFPTAFYFSFVFTESLFCMSLLGLLYWSEDDRKYAWIAAAAHGFLLSGTRIVGAALCIVPLLYSLLRHGRSGLRDPKLWFAVVATTAGTLAYLAYMQFRFGNWHLPFLAAASPGWEGRPNYWGVLDPKVYALFVPKMVHGLPYWNDLSRLAYPVFAAAILCVAVADGIRSRFSDAEFRSRAVLYGCSAVLWFVYLGARYYNSMGAIRYMLPVFVLLVLAVTRQLSRCRSKRFQCVLEVLLPLIAVVGFAIQAGYIHLFASGEFIA